MKILNFKLLLLLAVSVVLISNCSKDNSKPASPFIGNFVFTESKTALPLDIPVSTAGVDSMTLTAPAGTDITLAIEAALLGAINCQAVPTYIELRSDNSIYYSCQGNNAVNAGTWNEVSATELVLNLNSTAVPSSPTGIQLTISNIVTDASSITGVTTVPLPKEMIALFLPAQFTLHAKSPAYFIVTFSIKFSKVAK
jgi:hypothetical protein